MIDLTRHLNYPHGSLSPARKIKTGFTASESYLKGRSDPEPLSRIEARQDAESFTSNAVWLLLAFIILCTAIITHYLRA